MSTVVESRPAPGRGAFMTALTRVGRVLREVARRPGGLFGLVVVVGLFVVVVAAPLIAPYSATQQDIANRLGGHRCTTCSVPTSSAATCCRG